MAELADAQASGACGSNIVRVQIPFPASKWKTYIRGSVGTGRRARLRILWLLQSCGFKSHLPHDLKSFKPSKIKGLRDFSFWKNADLGWTRVGPSEFSRFFSLFISLFRPDEKNYAHLPHSIEYKKTQ